MKLLKRFCNAYLTNKKKYYSSINDQFRAKIKPDFSKDLVDFIDVTPTRALIFLLLICKDEKYDIEKGRWAKRKSYCEHFGSFYCPESKEIIERVYAEDFERFNYPFLNG